VPDGRPFVPLSGSIVTDHPGLLEVYQTIRSFGTEEQAVRWMVVESAGNADELVRPEEIRLLEVDEIVVRQSKPASPEYETRLELSMRLGNLVVGLGLQGGVDVTFDRMLPLVQDALSRVRTECGQ
jgi:hypothetical protein